MTVKRILLVKKLWLSQGRHCSAFAQPVGGPREDMIWSCVIIKTWVNRSHGCLLEKGCFQIIHFLKPIWALNKSKAMVLGIPHFKETLILEAPFSSVRTRDKDIRYGADDNRTIFWLLTMIPAGFSGNRLSPNLIFDHLIILVPSFWAIPRYTARSNGPTASSPLSER